MVLRDPSFKLSTKLSTLSGDNGANYFKFFSGEFSSALKTAYFSPLLSPLKMLKLTANTRMSLFVLNERLCLALTCSKSF